jgi:hypothetical protein
MKMTITFKLTSKCKYSIIFLSNFHDTVVLSAIMCACVDF